MGGNPCIKKFYMLTISQNLDNIINLLKVTCSTYMITAFIHSLIILLVKIFDTLWP